MIVETLKHRGTDAFPRDVVEIRRARVGRLTGIGGPTGAGKTTLFEQILAARHGSTAYRDVPLHDQFVVPGVTEMDFTVDPDRYRSVITVDPKAGRTEGMLWKNGNHIAGPLIRDFRKEAERQFGPKDLFLATAYAVQPKSHAKDTTGSFLRADRANRRSLMVEMLGERMYERRRGYSKSKADELEAAIDMIRARVTELEGRAAERAGVAEQRATQVQRLAAAGVLAETADKAVAAAQKRKGEAERALAVLEALQGDDTALEGEIRTLEARVRDAETRKGNNQGLLDKDGDIKQAVARDKVLLEERQRLVPVVNDKARAGSALKDLERRLRDAQKRLKDSQDLAARAGAIRAAVIRDAEVRALLAALEPLKAEGAALARSIEALQERVQDATGRRAEDQALIERAEAVRSAVAEVAGLTARRVQLDEDIELRETARRTASLAWQAASVARERLTGRQEHLVRLQAETAIVSAVPCRAEGEYAGCQFLLRAVETRKTDLPAAEMAIAELMAELEGAPEAAPEDLAAPLREERRRVVADIATHQKTADEAGALEAALARTEELDATLKALDRDVATQTARQAEVAGALAGAGALDTEIQSLAADVSLGTKLEAAVALVEELQPQVAALSIDVDAAKARVTEIGAAESRVMSVDQERATLASLVELEDRLAGAKARIAELTTQMEQANADVATKTARRREIAEQLARLPAATQEKQEAVDAETQAAAERRVALTAVSTAERELGILDGKLDTFAQADAELEVKRAELQPMLEDVADWLLLTRAFGPAGIPALLIDVALPEIGSLATDLLRECMGRSLFTISLTTQRPQSKGDVLAEVLDVIVTRNGKAMDVALLSGGEGALVSEALSLALAIYLARRSRIPVQTIMRDEAAAALDVLDGLAMGYVQMLRRVADYGRFANVFFISHQPECLKLADTRLWVRDGAVTVE